MQIKWLLDFLSLAQTKSFSKAAEERSVSQSALSRRIQAFEHWVGTELVDRSCYPVRLTSKGRAVQEQIAPLMSQLMNACIKLREKA